MEVKLKRVEREKSRGADTSRARGECPSPPLQHLDTNSLAYRSTASSNLEKLSQDPRPPPSFPDSRDGHLAASFRRHRCRCRPNQGDRHRWMEHNRSQTSHSERSRIGRVSLSRRARISSSSSADPPAPLHHYTCPCLRFALETTDLRSRTSGWDCCSSGIRCGRCTRSTRRAQ